MDVFFLHYTFGHHVETIFKTIQRKHIMKKLFTILTLTTLLTTNIHGMQSLQSNCTDAMKLIFDYVMHADIDTVDTDQLQKISGSSTTSMWCVKTPKNNKYTHRPDGLWCTIRRFHQLQYVSKDFKRIFWEYLKTHDRFSLEEKDEFIATLLRMWNQGMYHTHYLNWSPMPPIADIAVNIRANLYHILYDSIVVTNQKCNPKFVSIVIDACDSNIINYRDSGGYDILWFAIAYAEFSKESDNGHLKIIKLLLSHPDIQVNPLPGQKRPSCALYWAVYHNRIDIVQLLLAHPNIQINAVDGLYQGDTALFAAVRNFSDITTFSSMIDLLIAAGIDETITNKDGKTALDVARQYPHRAEKAKVLEEALAEKNLYNPTQTSILNS